MKSDFHNLTNKELVIAFDAATNPRDKSALSAEMFRRMGGIHQTGDDY